MGEEFADSVEHVEGAARQPVDPRHRHHVAGGQLAEHPAKLRPVGLGSARRFAERLARPVFPQRRDLSGDALPVGRYPCVAP